MSILDELGVHLATQHSHTRWVPLRELIEAIAEELGNMKCTPAQIAHQIRFALLTEVRQEQRIPVLAFVRAHFSGDGQFIDVDEDEERERSGIESEE
jgi:hypothetical protein